MACSGYRQMQINCKSNKLQVREIVMDITEGFCSLIFLVDGSYRKASWRQQVVQDLF